MIRVFDRYISKKSVTLAIVEAALMVFALVCGARLRFWDNALAFEAYVSGSEFLSQAAAFVVAFQVCFYYCDMYNLAPKRMREEKLIAIGQSLGAGCLLLGMLYFVFPVLVLGRGVFFISIGLVPAFVVVNRVALDRIWRAASPAAEYSRDRNRQTRLCCSLDHCRKARSQHPGGWICRYSRHGWRGRGHWGCPCFRDNRSAP